MRRNPQFSSKIFASPAGPVSSAGFAARLAGCYAANFTFIGIQMPFFPLWLSSQGLDAGDIGLALALPMTMRIVSIPIVSWEADRRGTLRGVLVLCVGTATILTALLGLGVGRAMIFVLIGLYALVYAPTSPLLDAYALKGLAERGWSYGPIRLWGSAAFILGNVGGGVVAGIIAPVHLIWLIVAALVLATLSVFLLAPLSPVSVSQDAPVLRPSRLLRLPGVARVILAASLIQASHAVFYGFSVLQWRSEGYDASVVGLLWATGVAAEIVLFAFSGRIPARVPPALLMCLGGAGAVLRWMLLAFDPGGPLLFAAQTLHALSYAATYLGTVAFLMRVVPNGLVASAQGSLAIANGVVLALATMLAGFLYESHGAGAYFAMAGFAACGIAVALTLFRTPPRAA
jgi:PPP family 3-phenylpropionic acid transporter